MDKLTIDITNTTPTLSFTTTGIPGPQGIQGIQGIRGEVGPKLTFADLTPLDKKEIQGAKGDKGDTGDSIKGDKGDQGIQGLQGEPLTYADLTPANKADLSKVATDATQPLVTQAVSACDQANSARDQTTIQASAAAASAEAARISSEASGEYLRAAQNIQQDVTGKATDVASKQALVNQAVSEVERDRSEVAANRNTVAVDMAAVQAARAASETAAASASTSAATATGKAAEATQEATRAKGYAESINTSLFVPAVRTVNGKPLSSDIALGAGDVGAVPIGGGTLTGPLVLAPMKNAIKVDNQKSISYQDGSSTRFHTMASGGNFLITSGDAGYNNLASFSPVGALATEGVQLSRWAQTARSKSETSLISIEAPEGGLPYISFKTPGLSAPVVGLQFTGDEVVASQPVAAARFRVAEDDGLRFSPNANLGGYSWGIGMDSNNGVLGVHKYQSSVWKSSPLSIGIDGNVRLISASIVGGLHLNTAACNWGQSTDAGIVPSNDGQFLVGSDEWHPLVTSPTYVQHTLGYLFRWQLGHYRPGGYNNGLFTLCLSGDGPLTNPLRYNFSYDGTLSTSPSSQDYTWSIGGDSGLYVKGSGGVSQLGSGGLVSGTRFGVHGNMVDWCMASFAAQSDANLKKNIKPCETTALDTIDKIEFKQFDWKDESRGHVDIGVTAQHMASINPQFANKICTFGADGSEIDPVMVLEMTNLLNLSLKGIQELQAEVQALKAKLEVKNDHDPARTE